MRRPSECWGRDSSAERAVQTLITLTPALIAAIIAVSVPWLTFRLALRQDRDRRLWEQRVQLYVDMLVEAHAEQRYFDLELLDAETRQRMASYLPDLRLPDAERVRLGARGTAFASQEVNRAFNRLQGHALSSTTFEPPRHEGERAAARMRVGDAMLELEGAIRRELGAEAGARPSERRRWPRRGRSAS